MEKLMYLLLHLGLPLLLLADVLLRPGRSKTGISSRGSAYILLIVFLYLWGQWAIVGSHYLRWILVVIIMLCLRRILVDLRNNLSLFPSNIITRLLNVAGFIVALLFGYLVVMAYQGRAYQSSGVEWDFPLGEGTYCISSGGSNRVLNNHIHGYMSSQYYALDINKLGPLRGASRGILAADPEKHYIFGEPVFAPCQGVVIETKSDVPDNTTSSMNVGPEDGTGNFVKLDCDGVIAFIPHLMENSISVEVGERIEVGTRLAKIGLSGFAQEPHLHIQAAVYDNDSTLVGVPIKFGSKHPVRNDIIKIE